MTDNIQDNFVQNVLATPEDTANLALRLATPFYIDADRFISRINSIYADFLENKQSIDRLHTIFNARLALEENRDKKKSPNVTATQIWKNMRDLQRSIPDFSDMRDKNALIRQQMLDALPEYNTLCKTYDVMTKILVDATQELTVAALIEDDQDRQNLLCKAVAAISTEIDNSRKKSTEAAVQEHIISAAQKEQQKICDALCDKTHEGSFFTRYEALRQSYNIKYAVTVTKTPLVQKIRLKR